MVHVGDYIYERRDTESLADFRALHSLYKTSPDLQAAHSAFPFVVTFDDHEVENNWANAESQPDGEASNANFLAMRAAAFQAYWENLPLRRTARPDGPKMRLYRRFRAGDVAATVPANPQVEFFDGSKRGYVRGTLTPDLWRSDYRAVTSASDTTNPATTLTSWVVENRRVGAEPA